MTDLKLPGVLPQTPVNGDQSPPWGITILTHSKEDPWVMFRFYTGFVIGRLFPNIKDMLLFIYIWYTVLAAYMYYIGNWWVFRHTNRHLTESVTISDSVLLSGFYICLYTVGIGLSTCLFMNRILDMGAMAQHYGHWHWWVELALIMGLMGVAALVAQYQRTAGHLALLFGQALVLVSFMSIVPASTGWFDEHVVWLASLALFSLFFFIRGVQSFTNVLIASTIHGNIIALFATNILDLALVLFFNLIFLLVIGSRIYHYLNH